MMQGGIVKEQIQKFAYNIKSDICIVFDKNTEIKEIEDDGTISKDFIFNNISLLFIYWPQSFSNFGGDI